MGSRQGTPRSIRGLSNTPIAVDFFFSWTHTLALTLLSIVRLTGVHVPQPHLGRCGSQSRHSFRTRPRAARSWFCAPNYTYNRTMQGALLPTENGSCQLLQHNSLGCLPRSRRLRAIPFCSTGWCFRCTLLNCVRQVSRADRQLSHCR